MKDINLSHLSSISPVVLQLFAIWGPQVAGSSWPLHFYFFPSEIRINLFTRTGHVRILMIDSVLLKNRRNK